MTELARLNAEYIRRRQWARTPEGRAYYAIGEEFRRKERERELRQIEDWFLAHYGVDE